MCFLEERADVVLGFRVPGGDHSENVEDWRGDILGFLVVEELNSERLRQVEERVGNEHGYIVSSEVRGGCQDHGELVPQTCHTRFPCGSCGALQSGFC